MSFEAQAKGSEGFVSEPQLCAGSLTGVDRLCFGNVPVNGKLIQPDKQPQIQDRGYPRVYYCGGTPRQLRAVFASAGFLRTEELLQATLVWARPQEAAEVQGLLGEGQWLNGIPELEPVLFRESDEEKKRNNLGTRHRCFVLLAETYPYSVYFYNRGLSSETKAVEVEKSEDHQEEVDGEQPELPRETTISEISKEKLEELAALVNKKMQKVASYLSKTDHLGPRHFALLGLDFFNNEDTPIITSGINFAHKDDQLTNEITLGFLIQAMNVLGIPFAPRPKIATPQITIPKRPHRIPEDPQFPKFVTQDGYFYQLVNGQYIQVDQRVYTQYFEQKEVDFRAKIKAWKQTVRKEAARAHEFFQELAAWREQQAEEEELRKQQVEENQEDQQKLADAAKERLEKMRAEETAISVKTYGVSQKVLALPVDRRARIVKNEALFYDYKLYSRLLAELRAAGGRFAKLEECELTQYEFQIVREKIEEAERAKAENFTAFYPSEDVRQYMRLSQRRYLNELVGCALRNGLLMQSAVQETDQNNVTQEVETVPQTAPANASE